MPADALALARFMMLGVFLVVFMAIVVLALFGCTATQVDTAAAYLHGRTDEYRAADNAAEQAKREAAKRVHCRTSVTDLYSMPKSDRATYLAYCGFE